jgi:hypothetical protein
VTKFKPFWTIGRKREKLHTAKFVKDAAGQSLIFPVIDCALDLNEGNGDSSEFVAVAKVAMIEGGSAVWQNAANWMRKIGDRFPETLRMWDELAAHPSWNVRLKVACVLYHDFPEDQSDSLFALLRHDKSAKVRLTSVDRYENRPGPDRCVVFKMFDSNSPTSPGYREGN